MLTLINGSPKVKASNSYYFLKKISNEKILNLKFEFQKVIDRVLISDTIVLAFPLYVDAPPSIVLEFLDYIIDNNIDLSSKKIYVIVNCGFREGEQNITAINIIKNWCRKVKIEYMGSLMIGAGEIVGKRKYRFISTKALKKLNLMKEYIESSKYFDDNITTMNFLNSKMYCSLANFNWFRQCKKNGLSKDDVLIQ